MLDAEFLKRLGLIKFRKYRLAKDIDVPPQRIGDMVAGKRAVTAGSDLRLCRYFGLSDGWWLRGQAAYDPAIVKDVMSVELSRINSALYWLTRARGESVRATNSGATCTYKIWATTLSVILLSYFMS